MRAGRTVMCPPQPSVPHLYVSLIMISYHCARLLLFEYPEKLIDALNPASRTSALRPPGLEKMPRTPATLFAARGGAWTRSRRRKRAHRPRGARRTGRGAGIRLRRGTVLRVSPP